MIAYVVTTRFTRTPDGRLWYANGILGHRFWTRYLDVYDEVRLVCQAVDASDPPEGWFEVTGPGVTGAPLPALRGPAELATHARGTWRELRRTMRQPGAVHLRGPSPLCDLAWFATPRKRPYGVEVAGDPYDSFEKGAYTGRLRRLYRAWFSSSLKRACRRAAAASYVTERALQARYPGGPDTFMTYFSSIEMGDEAFVSEPRVFTASPRPLVIVHVGTQNQLYKAPHVLIDSVAEAVARGVDARLIMVGDGQFRRQLESQAATRLGDRAEFTGRVPAGDGVRAQLDRADLFVLPSFQEGLPKVIVEAMARGLPCIGSTVGGIPELLEPEDLVPPGDIAALADRIEEVWRSPERLSRMADRNLRRSRDYHIDHIRKRRIAFYEVVKGVSEAGGWA